MSQEKLDLFTMREAYRTDDPKHPASWLVYVWSYKEKKRQRASMWHFEERGQPLSPLVVWPEIHNKEIISYGRKHQYFPFYGQAGKEGWYTAIITAKKTHRRYCNEELNVYSKENEESAVGTSKERGGLLYEWPKANGRSYETFEP